MTHVKEAGITRHEQASIPGTRYGVSNIFSKYPPAKPGALKREPLKAVVVGALARAVLSHLTVAVLTTTSFGRDAGLPVLVS